MDVKDWAPIAASIAGTAAALFAGLRFLIKSYLRELIPNGGNSMNDRIRRIEDTQVEMLALLGSVVKSSYATKAKKGRKKTSRR
ncbi:MAG: hypothetical protein EBT92_19065 [Planctomycetes bacterium]|jgi:hypothetical protein|nr:hypothetical protein [Planctomycetota bacterium]